mmetsp:Transcript_10560/g.9604  ORF Transcript_10560/g.9604 Transcript_10560/m.9604 type:complete len:187 (-) Transcript_10560:234-794(-)
MMGNVSKLGMLDFPLSILEALLRSKRFYWDDDEESISDVSDSEIEGYLLTPEESEAKSAIWHQWNKPYLMEWAIRDEQRKAKKRAEDEAKRNGTYKPRKRPVPSTAMGRLFCLASSSSKVLGSASSLAAVVLPATVSNFAMSSPSLSTPEVAVDRRALYSSSNSGKSPSLAPAVGSVLLLLLLGLA